jgi:hypothetical protein
VAQLQNALISVRNALLEEMRRGGFYYDNELRHDPTPWDINNGWCEEYANDVQTIAPSVDVVWLDGLLGDDAPAHCAILYQGRFYDAECISGVDDVHELPIFQERPRLTEES